jgi:hypothetical protein
MTQKREKQQKKTRQDARTLYYRRGKRKTMRKFLAIGMFLIAFLFVEASGNAAQRYFGVDTIVVKVDVGLEDKVLQKSDMERYLTNKAYTELQGKMSSQLKVSKDLNDYTWPNAVLVFASLSTVDYEYMVVGSVSVEVWRAVVAPGTEKQFPGCLFTTNRVFYAGKLANPKSYIGEILEGILLQVETDIWEDANK